MSVQTALDNIHLRPTSRWGHTEYSIEYHKPFLSRRTGLPVDHPDLNRRTYDLLEYDFLWSTNDGPIDWAKAGRFTDMGHAEYAADGSDKRDPSQCPFRTEEDVWGFDAVKEYGLPDFDELVRYYEDLWQKARSRRLNQLTTGGYYRTVVSGAIASFGWDMLLTAASDPVKFEKVLDGFFRRTLFHMQAWAQTSAPVLIQHDDFVWTSGPFIAPEFYRKAIIPRYAELWKPIHAAGKKLLFCSDGDFRQFAADVVAAGADGLIFEPVNDFGWMVEQFGQTSCLIGSYVDCRDLTFGNWDKVQRDVDRTFAKLQDCRGAIFAVGNHLPPNIPEAMIERFFAYMLPRLKR